MCVVAMNKQVSNLKTFPKFYAFGKIYVILFFVIQKVIDLSC